MSHNPIIAILAGGQSKRMGRDKAMLPFGNQTLLESIVGIACATGIETIVAGREQPLHWAGRPVAFVDDAPGRQGPLGGLLTVQAQFNDRPILLIGCDMPFMSTDALLWLIDAFETKHAAANAIVGRVDDQIEPLFAVYGPTTRVVVQRAFAAGTRSLRRILLELEAVAVQIPDAHLSAVININTEDQYSALVTELNNLGGKKDTINQ